MLGVNKTVTETQYQDSLANLYNFNKVLLQLLLMLLLLLLFFLCPLNH